MSDPSARVVRLATPVASPGHCVICGKVDHPLGFAWANLDFEFYGTVYLCADCVGEHARLFGYVSSDEIASLREHIALQDAELNTLRQENRSLESTVDNLAGTIARRESRNPLDSVPTSDSVSGSQVDGQVTPGPSDDVDGAVSDDDEAQPASDELAVEQGPYDLRKSGSADAGELLGL